MRAGLGSLVCLGLLAGCGGNQADPETAYRQVPVAVAVGCVKDRPEPPASISERVPAEEWVARAPGAKAASVEAQAGIRMNYQDRLAASVAGCREGR